MSLQIVYIHEIIVKFAIPFISLMASFKKNIKFTYYSVPCQLRWRTEACNMGFCRHFDFMTMDKKRWKNICRMRMRQISRMITTNNRQLLQKMDLDYTMDHFEKVGNWNNVLALKVHQRVGEP